MGFVLSLGNALGNHYTEIKKTFLAIFLILIFILVYFMVIE